jgi:hypothetical protein
MEWDGQQRVAREPRERINRRFPARYEDVKEGVRGENLEPDPEAQRLIDEKEKLDEERLDEKASRIRNIEIRRNRQRKKSARQKKERNEKKRSQP